jgi:DNA-binding response OmpR family regulator
VTRILVIEDERDLARGIADNLTLEGHVVEVASTGEAGLASAIAACPELVILDLMLPYMSGFEVLSQLRARYPDLAVLILSARAEEVDKVRGFRGGADDYVTKPFGVMELMLRVKALLRRSVREPAGATTTTEADTSSRERIGNVEVDLRNRVVLRDGSEVPLTPKALDLLSALLEKHDQVVTRQELLRKVWGYSADVTTRTVDAHIGELRRKIEDDPASPRHILTVWKAGYRLRR